jgi:hypothetical protein
MTTKHTPTPWRAETNPFGKPFVVGVNFENVIPTGCVGITDAAHIVRCVNAHDELVAALDEMVAMFGNGGPSAAQLIYGDNMAAIDRARAALVKVQP